MSWSRRYWGEFLLPRTVVVSRLLNSWRPVQKPLRGLFTFSASCYLLTDVRQPVTPRLNEVLRLIARLGGFLGRKGDGEPGAKAIWLGLKEVHVAARTLQKLRAGGHAGNCV
jgi:hypothetical protein